MDLGTSGGGRTLIDGLTTSSTCTNTRYRYIHNVVRGVLGGDEEYNPGSCIGISTPITFGMVDGFFIHAITVRAQLFGGTNILMSSPPRSLISSFMDSLFQACRGMPWKVSFVKTQAQRAPSPILGATDQSSPARHHRINAGKTRTHDCS